MALHVPPKTSYIPPVGPVVWNNVMVIVIHATVSNIKKITNSYFDVRNGKSHIVYSLYSFEFRCSSQTLLLPFVLGKDLTK